MRTSGWSSFTFGNEWFNAVFDPPYESPIEELFAWAAEKCFHPEVAFEKQVEIPTVCGTFHLDFLATRRQRIAFECDGREFHDCERDEWRDALILGTQKVDRIYMSSRERAYIASSRRKTRSRRHINLRRLASEEALRNSLRNEFMVLVSYGTDDAGDELSIKKREAGSERWREKYRYAVRSGCSSLDDLMAQHRRSNPTVLVTQKSGMGEGDE